MSTQPESAEPNKEQLAEGTLMSHLLELRSRLMWATMSVVGVFVCLVPFAQRVFEIVSAPLIAVRRAALAESGSSPAAMRDRR